MIGIAGCSCGGCCGKSLPCDRCLENTLKANGIPLDDIETFRGLKNKASGYEYPFEFSEMAEALRKYLQDNKKG